MRILPHWLRNLLGAAGEKLKALVSRRRFFTNKVMEPTMSKNKYDHLFRDDNVIYLPGVYPASLSFSEQQSRAYEASRIRNLGYRPSVVAGTDFGGPTARAAVYSLPPSGNSGRHW